MEKSVDYAQFAKNLTSRAANAKDWQVRTKRLRAMREIAREIQETGYIIASPKEMHEKYGDLYHFVPTAPDIDVKNVYAIEGRAHVRYYVQKPVFDMTFYCLCSPEDL